MRESLAEGAVEFQHVHQAGVLSAKLSVCEPERMPRKRQAMNFANCLFCDKGSEVGDLHQQVGHRS